jgi:hypothetical protein
VTRVFLKPARPPQDMQKFLNDFRRKEGNAAEMLDGVALVTQLLAIDTQGQLTPASAITDVQFRLFEKTPQGAFHRTRVGIYEISRKRLLSLPESGGMVEEGDNEPAYLPTAGNDYSFASPQIINEGRSTPLVVTQRTRCAFCHGDRDLTNVMTFSMMVFPQDSLGPEVRKLNPLGHESADFVISQKARDADWQTLHKYFEK